MLRLSLDSTRLSFKTIYNLKMASSSVLSMAAGMQASITQLRTEKDNLEAEAAALKAKTEYTQVRTLDSRALASTTRERKATDL